MSIMTCCFDKKINRYLSDKEYCIYKGKPVRLIESYKNLGHGDSCSFLEMENYYGDVIFSEDLILELL